MEERENENGGKIREGNGKKEEEEVKTLDLEKGEVGFEEKVIPSNNDGGNHNDHEEFQMSRFHRLNPTNPLRIVANSNTRVAAHSPSTSRRFQPQPQPQPHPQPQPQPQPHSQPRSTPNPQQVCFWCICREIEINFVKLTCLF